MLRKFLLAISLFLPLMALSAAAYAGVTISDKRYWPNEARPSAGTSQDKLGSAFAFDPIRSVFRPVKGANDPGAAWRYYGGPKSR